MITCGNCGINNQANDRFCSNCGAPLSGPPPLTPQTTNEPGKRNTVYFWGRAVPIMVAIPVLLCGLCVCGLILYLPRNSSNRASPVSDILPTEARRNVSDGVIQSPTSPRLATVTPASYKIGQTVAKGNWEYNVTKTEKNKTLIWSEFGNKTTAQGIFLIVYLSLKNIGTRNFSIHDWDFELRDSGGIKYSASSEGWSFVRYKNLVSLGDQMVPGLTVNSALIFDINPSAAGLKLWLGQADTSIDLGQ